MYISSYAAGDCSTCLHNPVRDPCFARLHSVYVAKTGTFNLKKVVDSNIGLRRLTYCVFVVAWMRRVGYPISPFNRRVSETCDTTLRKDEISSEPIQVLGFADVESLPVQPGNDAL
jgi:hypothetical protein